MATSKKVRYPSVGLKESALSPKKPEKKDKLPSFHAATSRFSFSHLAKVLTSGERLAMLNAVDKLKGRSRVLVELACFSNFQFVRLAAVINLSGDVEALIDIAKFCHYDDARASALDELSSVPSGLVEVACSSLFGNTRKSAVDLIVDTDSIVDVASRSPNKDSRSAALDRIGHNRSALARVADSSPYKAVRMSALKGLASDPDALCSLVHSKYPEVKKSAVSKLSDFVEDLDDAEALIEIAKASPHEDARYLAVGRISNDPLSLKSVISDSTYADAKSTALMLLSDMVQQLSDADVLSDVAMLSPYGDCRSAAVERLVGQSAALLNIANNSKFKDSRELAIQKLKTDVSALKQISRLSKYQDTRKKAHNLVAKPEVFASELSRILG